jgi:hypothetical protein
LAAHLNYDKVDMLYDANKSTGGSFVGIWLKIMVITVRVVYFEEE